MLRNILFFIKEAFFSTKKNGIMSLATIVSLSATLIIVGVLLLIFLNLNLFLETIESQLIAVAYLKDGVSEEKATVLSENLLELQGIKDVKYVSKEEAFKLLKDDLSEHKEILAGILENPLPSSIEISVDNSSFLEEIAFQLQQYEEIEEVDYGGQLTKNLTLVFDFIRNTGLIIIIVSIFTAILIMVSVIKISVHSRNKEIEIMALVGATSWFIRWPFIIEGFLKGLLSSLMATAVLFRFYSYYLSKMFELLPILTFAINESLIFKVSLILLLLGTTIGILGSMISLRKIRFEEI